MTQQELHLNSLVFSLPKEPVKCHFSVSNDAERLSTVFKSTMLVPSEVKQSPKFSNLFANCGGLQLYSSFDKPTKGFEAIPIDFNDPDNECFVKRFYNKSLEDYFRQFDDV